MVKIYFLLFSVFCLVNNSIAQSDVMIIKVKGNHAIINKGLIDGIKNGDLFAVASPNDPQKYGIIKVVLSMDGISAIKLQAGYAGYTLKEGDKELKNIDKIVPAVKPSIFALEADGTKKKQDKTNISPSAKTKGLSIKRAFYSETLHALGTNAEIGGIVFNNSLGSGYEARVSIGIFYSYNNTFVIEGNTGANSWNAPVLLYNPIKNTSYKQDSERIRKTMYALGAFRTPTSFKTKNGKIITPFIGFRSIWYSGFGKTNDALDSLYSSDAYENYESNNNIHLSFGFVWAVLLFRADIRLTNNNGNFSTGAYDPYGIGPSYYYEVNGVDETRIMFHLGVCGLVGK